MKKMNRRTFLKVLQQRGLPPRSPGFQPSYAPRLQRSRSGPSSRHRSDLRYRDLHEEGESASRRQYQCQGGIKSMGGAKLKLLLADTRQKRRWLARKPRG